MFYPKFLKMFNVANSSKYDGYYCSLILSFKAANLAVSYLTEVKFTDDWLTLNEVLET